jgi:hypothetical protein
MNGQGGLGEMLQMLAQQGIFTPPQPPTMLNSPGEALPPPPPQPGPEQLPGMLAGAQGGGQIPPEIMALIQALLDAQSGMGQPQIPGAQPLPQPPAVQPPNLMQEINDFG